MIQKLYEVLDDYVDQVVMLRDEFSESGNLTDLVNALASAGSTGYTLSQGVNDVITALKFNSD